MFVSLFPRCRWWIPFAVACLIGMTSSVHGATHPSVTLAEITQAADLIAVGTVESATSRWNEAHQLILTDIVLRDVETVHASARALQASRQRITITRVGGVVGDEGMQVTGQPLLAVEHRYLVCLRDRGDLLLDPIVGGDRGVFEIARDQGTGVEGVYACSGWAVTAVSTDGLAFGARLATVRSGAAHEMSTDRLVGEMPLPVGNESEMLARPLPAAHEASSQPALSLAAFTDYLISSALRQRVDAPVLRWEGRGSLIELEDDGTTIERPLESSAPPLAPRPQSIRVEPAREMGNSTFSNGPAQTSASPTDIESSCGGGAMGACGYFSLPIVMEQVPSTWWSWVYQNNAMACYNQFMDLFRYRDPDGTVGDNSQNEFCGWVSDADLRRGWGGAGWGGGLAVTVISWTGGQCGRHVEADVMYNPAYSWTSNREVVRQNPLVVLLLPTTIHEVGHVWGDQSQIYTETYDYDHLSVMHGYDPGVEEDGEGIHAVDAYLIRRHYQSQRSITSFRDVGVESYYACRGLTSGTISGSSFRWQDAITLSGVTVENMSYSAVSDVRLRFYLSSDRVLNAGDQQIGGYWSWGSFNPEAYNTAAYTLRMPEGTRGGQYYVLASVTINGDGQDDYAGNNVTSFPTRITVLNPIPQITSVQPAFVDAEGSQIITVSGSGFTSGTTGVGLTPGLTISSARVNSTTSMSITLSGLSTAALGVRTVTVSNPSPGGGATSVSSAFSLAVTVYPGDADRNGRVDARDILPIGRYFGETGAVRSGASLTWGPQRLFSRWGSDADPHADCNGDGLVNESDVAGIVQNWGATRGGTEPSLVDHSAVVADLLATLDEMPQDEVTRSLRAAIAGLSEPAGAQGEHGWLAAAAPNPFNESTLIRFRLPARVPGGRLEIFDAVGHLVWRRDVVGVDGPVQLRWNGRSRQESLVPAGQYFIRLSAPGFSASRRLLRLP